VANTYTWNFTQLDAAQSEDGLTDVVKTVHFQYQAVSDQTNDDGHPYASMSYGTATLGSADSGSFTAFDSITQDQVKGWVLAALEKTEEEMQSMLDERINAEISPPVVGKLPSSW